MILQESAVHNANSRGFIRGKLRPEFDAGHVLVAVDKSLYTGNYTMFFTARDERGAVSYPTKGGGGVQGAAANGDIDRRVY